MWDLSLLINDTVNTDVYSVITFIWCGIPAEYTHSAF